MSIDLGVPPRTDRVSSILEAAGRVVVRDGAHGLRMASVAAEAGVSKALVHYYFQTRHELLRNAFVYAEQRLNEAVDAQLATLETGAERLDRALSMSVDADTAFGRQRALWNEVWSTLSLDEELGPLVETCYRAWLGRLVTLVEEGRADGSIPAGVDPQEAAWRLGALADGVDSLLYLGLLDRDGARKLLLGGLARELADA